MSSYSARLCCALALLALSCVVACHKFSAHGAGRAPARGTVEWTAIDVNTNEVQADASLVRFSDGNNYLIDAGNANGKLISELEKQDVHSIDAVIISHAHPDHYNGIPALLDSSIQVKRVLFNVPDRGVCDSEKPWGCNYSEVEEMVSLLGKRSIQIGSVKPGDVIHRDGKISFEVLYAYDGVNTPVGRTDVNDMSAIMLLSNDAMKVLFTGDLNMKVGTYLAGTGEVRLKAQFLKMPHHGADLLAPNSFFDWVDPGVVVVPAPAKLWQSDRCKRARDWTEGKRLPTYVTGASGNFKVTLEPHRYDIVTQ